MPVRERRLQCISLTHKYIENQIGLKTDPCGTPLATLDQEDKLLLNTTLYSLLLSQLLIQFSMSPWNRKKTTYFLKTSYPIRVSRYPTWVREPKVENRCLRDLNRLQEFN